MQEKLINPYQFHKKFMRELLLTPSLVKRGDNYSLLFCKEKGRG